jgi:hypothetical protein
MLGPRSVVGMVNVVVRVVAVSAVMERRSRFAWLSVTARTQ